MDYKLFLNKLYLNRKVNSIKNDYGKCLIIGGSKKYPGAPIMACLMAELTNCGYSAISVPSTIYNNAVNLVSPNTIHEVFSIDDDFYYSDDILNYDSILFGNGININKNNHNLLIKIIEKYSNNLIFDGGALELLSKNNDILLNKKPNLNILLTPHLGEANKLFNINIKSRNSFDYLDYAIKYAKKYNVNILLKSYNSLYVNYKGDYYKSNYKETPILAKAGSGDSLAGLLCGFLAYGTNYFNYDELIVEVDNLFHNLANLISLKNNYLDIYVIKKEFLNLINGINHE